MELNKVGAYAPSKEMGNALVTTYDGKSQIRGIKINIHAHRYEPIKMLQMNMLKECTQSL